MKYRGTRTYHDPWGTAYAEHRNTPPPETRKTQKIIFPHLGMDGAHHDLSYDPDDVTFERSASGLMMRTIFCPKCRTNVTLGGS